MSCKIIPFASNDPALPGKRAVCSEFWKHQHPSHRGAAPAEAKPTWISELDLLFKAQVVAQKGKSLPAKLHRPVLAHDNPPNRMLSRVKCFPPQQSTSKSWAALCNYRVKRVSPCGEDCSQGVPRSERSAQKLNYVLCTRTLHTSLNLSLNLLTQDNDFAHKLNILILFDCPVRISLGL